MPPPPLPTDVSKLNRKQLIDRMVVMGWARKEIEGRLKTGELDDAGMRRLIQQVQAEGGLPSAPIRKTFNGVEKELWIDKDGVPHWGEPEESAAQKAAIRKEQEAFRAGESQLARDARLKEWEGEQARAENEFRAEEVGRAETRQQRASEFAAEEAGRVATRGQRTREFDIEEAGREKTRAQFTPSMDDLVNRRIIAGDFTAATALADFRDRPTSQQALDAALAYARSPADVFTISNIAAGNQLVTPPPPLGQTQRIGPQAGFLTDAYNRYQQSLNPFAGMAPRTFADTAPGTPPGPSFPTTAAQAGVGSFAGGQPNEGTPNATGFQGMQSPASAPTAWGQQAPGVQPAPVASTPQAQFSSMAPGGADPFALEQYAEQVGQVPPMEELVAMQSRWPELYPGEPVPSLDELAATFRRQTIQSGIRFANAAPSGTAAGMSPLVESQRVPAPRPFPAQVAVATPQTQLQATQLGAFRQQQPTQFPARVQTLLAGGQIAPPASLFRAAGMSVPSAQAWRNMLPSEQTVYRETGRLAGMYPEDFERELQTAIPGQGRRTVPFSAYRPRR